MPQMRIWCKGDRLASEKLRPPDGLRPERLRPDRLALCVFSPKEVFFSADLSRKSRKNIRSTVGLALAFGNDSETTPVPTGLIWNPGSSYP